MCPKNMLKILKKKHRKTALTESSLHESFRPATALKEKLTPSQTLSCEFYEISQNNVAI